jgi:nucleotide-binding universal stress UspA family protein
MYRRILIAVDARPVSMAAVREGVALAAAHGAEAVFFHPLPPYPVAAGDLPVFISISPQEFAKASKGQAGKALSAAQAEAVEAGVASIKAMGTGESEAHCIADAARKRRCDLIVVATTGKNALLRLLTGSVVPGLITAATVPVLVVKDGRRTTSAAGAAVVPPKPRRAAKVAAATPMPRTRGPAA